MKFKYVVSNYDPITGTFTPVAVFDDEESANQYAIITIGDTSIDGWSIVDKVVSFLDGSE